MTYSPLRLFSALSLILLAGCSSRTELPAFTASGYLADRGIVRIWRKEIQPDTRHMLTVYTPFNGAEKQTTHYLWQDDKLVSIERQSTGEQPDSITLRFDQNGKLSFMQRQLAGHREALSEDAVALYQFDAGRMLKISDDLLKGRVLLKQGRWSAPGTITSCQGSESSPDFDRYSLNYITQHQRESGKPVSLAWLEAPEGTQLLLVAPEDLCATEPKEADF
ncbi:DUF1481 domain-containing protein [Erwinia sp. P6884]|uniref:DUF1481 domain-containing protein n=1 Tax=Erwinia sp. P6884 TaxID=3141450 RepID=UPI00318DCD36